jgi:nitrile hydratase
MSNTIHDMGGMHGFGTVEPEPNEPVFHAEWEGRVLAMQRAMGYARLWTIDGGRASIETLPLLEYLGSSYYRRWFLGLERRLVAHDLVGEDEIKAGKALRPGRRLNRKLVASDVPNTMTRGNFERPAPAPAKFQAGDQVKTRNINPIETVRGCHVYPDTAALGVGDNPQWLYTVVFTGRELWGEEADPSITVSIEAFEPYLLPA